MHWRDEANADGEPLEAYIHVTPEKVEELEKVRGQLGAAPTKMATQARRTLVRDRETKRQGGSLSIPEGVVPYAVRDFIEGYEEHVTDCVDRIQLNVAGHAPHDVLEAARNNQPPPKRYQRRKHTAITEFAKRRQKETQDADA